MKLETVNITTTGDNDLHYRARQMFRDYRKAVLATDPASTTARGDAAPDDVVLMRSYREIARGRRVLHLGQVMAEAGLTTEWLPKLAIARADATHCAVSIWSSGGARFWSEKDPDRWNRFCTSSRKRAVPEGTFQKLGSGRRDAWCVAPSIPPPFRPKHALLNYHLLWEAHWHAVPADPLLLRHLGGNVFAVLAQWDLTPIEQAVLRGRL